MKPSGDYYRTWTRTPLYSLAPAGIFFPLGGAVSVAPLRASAEGCVGAAEFDRFGFQDTPCYVTMQLIQVRAVAIECFDEEELAVKSIKIPSHEQSQF